MEEILKTAQPTVSHDKPDTDEPEILEEIEVEELAIDGICGVY